MAQQLLLPWELSYQFQYFYGFSFSNWDPVSPREQTNGWTDRQTDEQTSNTHNVT